MEVFGFSIWYWVSALVIVLLLWEIVRLDPKKTVAKTSKKKK